MTASSRHERVSPHAVSTTLVNESACQVACA